MCAHELFPELRKSHLVENGWIPCAGTQVAIYV